MINGVYFVHEAPGLSDAYGQKYKDLYTKYENEGKLLKL